VLADAYVHELGESENAGRSPDGKLADPARYSGEDTTGRGALDVVKPKPAVN
jgi:hypothetical protein